LWITLWILYIYIYYIIYHNLFCIPGQREGGSWFNKY